MQVPVNSPKKKNYKKIFSPQVRCLKEQMNKEISPKDVPFIAASKFTEEKKGYVFFMIR